MIYDRGEIVPGIQKHKKIVAILVTTIGCFIALVWVVLPAVTEWRYNNDDFAPYTSFRRSIGRQSSINSLNLLSDLLPEANEVAKYFDEEVVLTRISFTTEDLGQTGNINFVFARLYERRNQVTVITVVFDINDMMFDSVEFRRGHSKRVSAILEPIGMVYMEMAFDELFSEVAYLLEKDLDEISNAITIELTRNRICAYSQGESGRLRICR